MTELLLLTVLGGVLALDETSVGQFMVARPLVAGTLAGVLLGDPALGITIGSLLELFLLVSIPSGGARFPEGSTSSVVAVAVASSVSGAGAYGLGVAAGLVVGHVGAMSITAMRHWNVRWAPDASGETSASGIARAHLLGISSDFVRASALTAVGVTVGRAIAGAAAPAWPLDDQLTWALLLTGAAVSIGVLFRDLAGARWRSAAWVVGAALGVLGVTVL